MHLRRRTTQALAGAGAFMIVTGLSLGGGVAVASTGPAAGASLGSAKVTTASSGKKPGKTGSKDDRKARRSTSTTAGDTSGTDPSTTETSASTATTATTATTGPTATSVPPTTAAAATSTTTTTATAPAEPAPTGFTGQYNGGQPYQATEAPGDESSTTTAPAGRTAGATKPASRSGSGLPPGIYPADPGSKTADSPAPATASAPTPLTPVVPLPNPVAPAESVPGGETTTSSVAPAAADPGGTADAPGTEVRSANQTSEESPAAAVRSRQLSQTGDGTRRLIILGGIVLLIGAVVVAFAGREHPMLLAAPALPPGPARRRPRPRREIDGWEDGIPLAPVKRELARHRLGISGDPYDSYSDGEPGA
jgi:hypothetical protein